MADGTYEPGWIDTAGLEYLEDGPGFDVDFIDGDDEEEEALMNCGRYPDGGCSLAGTWECEAECPYR